LPKLRPYTFHGTVIQSEQVSPDLTLTTQYAQKASLSDFRGKLILLYFGYTFCPDVCPTTLSEVSQAIELLGNKAEDVQVIMVTVDPERDTPEQLGTYLAHFNPEFLGMTGTQEEIDQAAALYGVYFQKHEGTEATGYLVDHTASLMVIDEEGHLKLIYPFGTPASDIADDLAYLLR
jgi:protein SCO1/2